MFAPFPIDLEWEEDIGWEGAINRELEVRPGSRTSGQCTLWDRLRRRHLASAPGTPESATSTPIKH